MSCTYSVTQVTEFGTPFRFRFGTAGIGIIDAPHPGELLATDFVTNLKGEYNLKDPCGIDRAHRGHVIKVRTSRMDALTIVRAHPDIFPSTSNTIEQIQSGCWYIYRTSIGSEYPEAHSFHEFEDYQ